jgi:ATP-binding cassette, subfamily A (ABC1), member 3
LNYPASQYGAIYFTHEPDSTIAGTGQRFNDTVVNECFKNTNGYNYSMPSDCRRFAGVGYLIQYNFSAFHVAPTLQALATQGLARRALDSSNFIVDATIDALPLTELESKISESDAAFAPWFLVVLSFPFIAGSFATFVVQERESKAKHLQTVAGVQPWAYWMSTYIWDTANYMIPMVLTILFMLAFDVGVLTSMDRNIFGGVVATLFLYGPASAGFTYCISFGFTNPSLCNIIVIISGFLIGMGGSMTCWILELIGNDISDPSPSLIDVANVLAWILRFHPAFCLARALLYAINIDMFNIFYPGTDSAWTKHMMLYDVVFLAWESIIYIALAVQLDVWSSNPKAMARWNGLLNLLKCAFLFSRKTKDDSSFTVPEDSDVLAEQDRVMSGEANDDLIVLSELTKVYSDGVKAVDRLSFGIPHGMSRLEWLSHAGASLLIRFPVAVSNLSHCTFGFNLNLNMLGECFGLLGINGAGKTTTLQMLTAEFPPTSGDATLAGYSVSAEPQKTRRRVGYCPQFDAHFPNLSGREHVELYASVKGVPKHLLEGVVAAKLREVGLSDVDSDRLTSQYSGGMRRRLSLACATIGQPQIVFLDECSTGVDPVARREIWQLVSDMVTANVPYEERTSVILTTHSMEECEALCPRIGIMTNGRLRCLGSAQHLKDKFGQGYQIEMKCKQIDKEDVDFVENLSILSEFKAPGQRFTEDMLFNTFFTLSETKNALNALASDGSLSALVAPDNANGYGIYKDATSAVGVTLDEVAAFATIELRIQRMETFIQSNFPTHVLRERQAHKVRYEVGSQGIKVSSIFSLIESNKNDLLLDDYGVSQTTLEQVFNHHAEEAEALKASGTDT